MQRKRELAAKLWSLALVPAGFAAFVAANGGVVIGDRANHAPAAHWAQPLYALLFTAVAFAPMHLHPRRCVCTWSRSSLTHMSPSGQATLRVWLCALGAAGLCAALHRRWFRAHARAPAQVHVLLLHSGMQRFIPYVEGIVHVVLCTASSGLCAAVHCRCACARALHPVCSCSMCPGSALGWRGPSMHQLLQWQHCRDTWQLASDA